LILLELLSLQEADFHANFRGLMVPRSRAIRGRDGFAVDFGRGHQENLSGAISWFTFSPAEQLASGPGTQLDRL
jgi:hypothetical protein